MKIIHIVGRSGSGKTALMVELITELNNRGLKVGSLKHSSRDHELDKPGKDSDLHRQAGSNPTAVAAKNQMAVFLPKNPDENPLDRLSSLFEHCDIVLVEGYLSGPGQKVEVWRAANNTDPIVETNKEIMAVITDDQITTDRPVWPRNDVVFIADKVMDLLAIKS